MLRTVLNNAHILLVVGQYRTRVIPFEVNDAVRVEAGCVRRIAEPLGLEVLLTGSESVRRRGFNEWCWKWWSSGNHGTESGRLAERVSSVPAYLTCGVV